MDEMPEFSRSDVRLATIRNRKRARRAAAAANKFGGDIDLEANVVDLLTDLRHLVDQTEYLNWAKIEASAEMHYDAEIHGEP